MKTHYKLVSLNKAGYEILDFQRSLDVAQGETQVDRPWPKFSPPICRRHCRRLSFHFGHASAGWSCGKTHAQALRDAPKYTLED